MKETFNFRIAIPTNETRSGIYRLISISRKMILIVRIYFGNLILPYVALLTKTRMRFWKYSTEIFRNNPKVRRNAYFTCVSMYIDQLTVLKLISVLSMEITIGDSYRHAEWVATNITPMSLCRREALTRCNIRAINIGAASATSLLPPSPRWRKRRFRYNSEFVDY